MTTQTEALKLALEALESERMYFWNCPEKIETSIAAIKEALAQPEQERCVGCEACIDTACGRDECPKGWPKAAQPEQEPVATVKRNSSGQIYIEWRDGEFAMANLVEAKFYTTPPQRKPLTDEQITAFWETRPYFNDFARAIEAAHGIKE